MKLSKTEDRIPYELRYLRQFQSYIDTIGELKTPCPPQPYIGPPRRNFA